MGCSLQVTAIKPGDAEHKKKVTAWFACKSAGVNPPDTLYDYFEDSDEGEGPEPNMDAVHVSLCGHPCRRDDLHGPSVTIDIGKLPKGTKQLLIEFR